MSIEVQLERIAVTLESLLEAMTADAGSTPGDPEEELAPEKKGRRKTKDTPAEVKGPTLDDVRTKAQELVNAFPEEDAGYDKAKEIIQEHGADQMADLAPEKYQVVIEAMGQAMKLPKKKKTKRGLL